MHRFQLLLTRGCFTYFDLAKIARLECADAVVLKVCKSGGLAECFKSVHVAEANSLELLGSGLTEAGIGFIASVHLFSLWIWFSLLNSMPPLFWQLWR